MSSRRDAGAAQVVQVSEEDGGSICASRVLVQKSRITNDVLRRHRSAHGVSHSSSSPHLVPRRRTEPLPAGGFVTSH